jgi:hypothetical protein
MKRCRSALVQLVAAHYFMAKDTYPLFKVQEEDILIDTDDGQAMGLHLHAKGEQRSVVVICEDAFQGDVRILLYITKRAFDVYHKGVVLSGCNLRQDEQSEVLFPNLLVSDGAIASRLNEIGAGLVEFMLHGKKPVAWNEIA